MFWKHGKVECCSLALFPPLTLLPLCHCCYCTRARSLCIANYPPCRWIINAANKRKQSSKATSMAECLALELLLAYRKEGSARAKRDEMHKTALENKSNVSGYSLK